MMLLLLQPDSGFSSTLDNLNYRFLIDEEDLKEFYLSLIRAGLIGGFINEGKLVLFFLLLYINKFLV